MQKLPKFAVTMLALACTVGQAWADEPAPMPFSELAAKCAPTVHQQTLKSLIGNESTYNPYAIGVVGGRLERQPQSLREAVATAERLEREGQRFSVGIGQLLVTNMRAMGMTYAEAFEPCQNLKAISDLMVKNYTKALTSGAQPQEALRDSFSMYYSGNRTRGYQPDKPGDPSYVEKVVTGALNPTATDPIVPAVEALEGDEAIAMAVPSQGASKAPVRARRASQQQSGPWVIVTDENGQQVAPVQAVAFQSAPTGQAQAPEQPKVQVLLNTDVPESDQRFQRFDQPLAAPASAPARAPAPVQAQAQAAPSFVQIIN